MELERELDSGEADTETVPDESDDDTEQPEPDPGNTVSDPSSQQELRNLVESLQQATQANVMEIARLRDHVAGKHQQNGASHRPAQDDTFIRGFKEAYEKDPASAIAAAINKGRQQNVEDSLVLAHKLIGHHRIIQTAIDEMLNHPKAVHLKPHRSQIEFLVMEQGLDPVAAVATVASKDDVRAQQTSRRSAAAKEIRTRSDVESGGEARSVKSKDHDLEQALTKAKTLDEMFANLRKLKV